MTDDVIKWENGPYSIDLPEIHVYSGSVSVGISSLAKEKLYIRLSNGTSYSEHRFLTPQAARHLASLLIKTADEYEGGGF